MANQEKKTEKNFSTSTARRRNDSLGYDEGCVYAGQTYSNGSIINQAGERMKCSSGSWVPAKKAASKTISAVTKKGI